MCHKCGEPFEKDQGFHERNNFPYCKACYVELACEKCAGCSKPITDKAIKALDKDWHVACFVCKVSSVGAFVFITSLSFFVLIADVQ